MCIICLLLISRDHPMSCTFKHNRGQCCESLTFSPVILSLRSCVTVFCCNVHASLNLHSNTFIYWMWFWLFVLQYPYLVDSLLLLNVYIKTHDLFIKVPTFLDCQTRVVSKTNFLQAMSGCEELDMQFTWQVPWFKPYFKTYDSLKCLQFQKEAYGDLCMLHEINTYSKKN